MPMYHASSTAIISAEERVASKLVTHQLSVKEVLRSWYLCALSPRGGLKEQTAI